MRLDEGGWLRQGGVLLAVGVMLIGCTSAVAPLAETKPVPADRLRYHGQPVPAARIVVIRDTHWYSPDRYRDFIMDNIVIAQMMTGERVEFDAPVGDHVFAAQIPEDRAIGNPLRLPPATVPMLVEAGKTYYLHMGKDENGMVTLRRTFSADR